MSRRYAITDTCSVTGCDKRAHARGWCGMHYSRWRTHGDPSTVKEIHGDPTRRFWSKVDKTGSCWLWTGGRSPLGYGLFRLPDRNVPAHRYSYELANGPAPARNDRGERMVIDHLCRTPPCVRPDHLELVTDRTNIVVRGVGITAENVRKTHCPSGHPYDTANTYIDPRRGVRSCRECRNHHAREYQRRKRESPR